MKPFQPEMCTARVDVYMSCKIYKKRKWIDKRVVAVLIPEKEDNICP